MGRAQTPLDSSEGPIQAFANDLRDLRRRAGEPTLDSMAARTEISKSAFSEAMAGRRLPSEKTLRAFVLECHGDPGAWVERRNRIAKAIEDGSAGSMGDLSKPRRVPLLAAIIAGAGGLIVGAALALVAVLVIVPWTQRPTTGEDPANTDCVLDATAALYEPQDDGTLLEMRYSKSCVSNWARITRSTPAAGNSITVTIRGDYPGAPAPMTVTETDVQSAYTPMLVLPDGNARVCVSGSIMTDGVETEYPEACG